MNQQKYSQTLLCIAHRGAMGHAPENTIASIQKALELGAPCIEIDVYSVNGDLLVIHDERLERTTNGKGKLWDHDFGYLRSLDAGNGERIPTLAEVCGEIDGRACLNIELKGANVAADVVYFIQNMLDPDVSCWRREQLLISSFDHRALEQVHKLDPSLNLAALGYSIPTSYAHFAQELGAIAVNPSLELIDQVYVDDAHARGLKVYVYTVNEPEDIQAMATMGVDGVFTNYPERVLAHYQQPDLNKGWTS
jgi:glycerophosphoryl diester phosphodiesterase